MLLVRKSTHMHKFLHLFGNIFESFLVLVKDLKHGALMSKKSWLGLGIWITLQNHLTLFVIADTCQKELVANWANLTLIAESSAIKSTLKFNIWKTLLPIAGQKLREGISNFYLI